MAAQKALVLNEICKIYRMADLDVLALKSLSLSVEYGEYLVVMGTSGSGKSTLLNLLGCLDRPSSGQYILGGEDVSKKSDDELSMVRNRHIGFVFQSFNLIPQLSVLENIEVPLFYATVTAKAARQRSTELAKRVGLGHRLTHRPTELSAGQLQRVALARSLSTDPTLILADEPTGNLDSTTEAEILDLLDEVNGRGKTLIVVTHDDRVARRAHRIVFLKDGEIDQEIIQ